MKIDVEELLSAFTWSSDDMEHVLDRNTGRVLLITTDDRRVYEDLLEMQESEPSLSFADACAKLDEAGWQIQSLENVREVEEDRSDRFIAVPTLESREGFQDMESFIETVEDEHIRDLLAVAINGRGAFRRFKDVIAGWPIERERWFSFHRERNIERIKEWLEGEEITLEV